MTRPDDAPVGDTTPFAGLDPAAILDALESIGLAPDGRLLALNSYENRVYQVWLDEGPPLVAKFYRPARWSDAQIIEEHAFLAELAADEVPAVAPLVIGGHTLHAHAGLRFAVFPRQPGRAPELVTPEARRQMGRLLARTHVVGARHPFIARPALDIDTFGREPLAFLRGCGLLEARLGEVYFGVVEQALTAVAHAWARAGSVASIRLHGDCHLGNVLWREDRSGFAAYFLDFDDARRGPAVQDLWMLLSGSREEREEQLGDLLAGYRVFRDFDRAELHLIEPLRTLRLIHYAAWIARRWDDPAFPAAFPWFATPRYWEDRILELREQIALLDEPPLSP